MEPALHAGRAWLSSTFMEFTAFRPRMLPAVLGKRFHLLTHSTPTRVPATAGSAREAHLVLEACLDSRLVGTLGQALAGFRTRVCTVDYVTDGSAWRMTVQDGRQMVFNAMIRGSMLGQELPRSSRFDSTDEAIEFFQAPVDLAQWDGGSGLLSIMPQRLDGEAVQLGTCDTRAHALLERLGHRYPRADHAICVKNSHWQGATRAIELALPAA